MDGSIPDFIYMTQLEILEMVLEKSNCKNNKDRMPRLINKSINSKMKNKRIKKNKKFKILMMILLISLIFKIFDL